MVLPKSPLRLPNDMFETPPASAFSKTEDKAGTTLSLSDPDGSNPRVSKSFARARNSLLTMWRVARIKPLQVRKFELALSKYRLALGRQKVTQGNMVGAMGEYSGPRVNEEHAHTF